MWRRMNVLQTSIPCFECTGPSSSIHFKSSTNLEELEDVFNIFVYYVVWNVHFQPMQITTPRNTPWWRVINEHSSQNTCCTGWNPASAQRKHAQTVAKPLASAHACVGVDITTRISHDFAVFLETAHEKAVSGCMSRCMAWVGTYTAHARMFPHRVWGNFMTRWKTESTVSTSWWIKGQ